MTHDPPPPPPPPPPPNPPPPPPPPPPGAFGERGLQVPQNLPPPPFPYTPPTPLPHPAITNPFLYPLSNTLSPPPCAPPPPYPPTMFPVFPPGAFGERGLQVLQNLVLSFWSNHTSSIQQQQQQSAAAAGPAPSPHTGLYLSLYFALGLGSVGVVLVRSALLVLGSVSASRRLHRQLLHKLLRLPMSFFDAQPSGKWGSGIGVLVCVCVGGGDRSGWWWSGEESV